MGLSRKVHNGSQPSLMFQTSKFSAGTFDFTYILCILYLRYSSQGQVQNVTTYLCFINFSSFLVSLITPFTVHKYLNIVGVTYTDPTVFTEIFSYSSVDLDLGSTYSVKS